MEEKYVFRKEENPQEGIGRVWCTIRPSVAISAILLAMLIGGSLHVFYRILKGDAFVLSAGGSEGVTIPLLAVCGIVALCLTVACVVGVLTMRTKEGMQVGEYGIQIGEDAYPYGQLQEVTLRRGSFMEIRVKCINGTKKAYTWLHFPKKKGAVLNQINDFLKTADDGAQEESTQ